MSYFSCQSKRQRNKTTPKKLLGALTLCLFSTFTANLAQAQMIGGSNSYLPQMTMSIGGGTSYVHTGDDLSVSITGTDFDTDATHSFGNNALGISITYRAVLNNVYFSSSSTSSSFTVTISGTVTAGAGSYDMNCTLYDAGSDFSFLDPTVYGSKQVVVS